MKDEKKEKNLELRELFLRGFIESIIISISPKTSEIEGKSFAGGEIGYMPSLGSEISHLGATEIVGPMREQKISPRVEEISTRTGIIPSPIQHGEAFPYVRKQAIAPIKIQPFSTPVFMGERIPLGKLVPFLSDPTVLGIECPGPGKNILVHKFGVIQTTPIVLMQSEIDEIMKNISERTRIPIIQGVFKAALDNVIVTAVISEFVGTRFYIEKMRMQYSQYPQYRR